MSSPYRESDRRLAPVDDVAWRRKVGKAAAWLVVWLVANIATRSADALQSLPWRATLAVAALWFATYLGLTSSTWSLTAARPGSRVHWLGWTLRVAVVLPLALAALALAQVGIGLDLDATNTALGALLSLAGLAYVAHLFAAVGQRRQSREAIVLAVLSSALGSGFAISHSTPWASFTAVWLIWGSTLLWRLRRTLLLDDCYWWFDTEMESPGEWVAVLVHRDKHSEVIRVDETLGWFASEGDATEWLEDNGYVPAERALVEHLVDSIPPDIVPAARRRKRLRVEQSEPRVRVESDTSHELTDGARDGATDDLDENAVADGLDTAEPPRSLTVEKPHEH